MEIYSNILNDFINTTYINNFPIDLQDKIKYLFNDGKKIRPILCLCFSGISKFDNNIENNIENNILINL